MYLFAQNYSLCFISQVFPSSRYSFWQEMILLSLNYFFPCSWFLFSFGFLISDNDYHLWCGWEWLKSPIWDSVFSTMCSLMHCDWPVAAVLHKEPLFGSLCFFDWLWLKSSLLVVTVWEAFLPLLLYPWHPQLNSYTWNYSFCLFHLLMEEKCGR